MPRCAPTLASRAAGSLLFGAGYRYHNEVSRMRLLLALNRICPPEAARRAAPVEKIVSAPTLFPVRCYFYRRPMSGSGGCHGEKSRSGSARPPLPAAEVGPRGVHHADNVLAAEPNTLLMQRAVILRVGVELWRAAAPTRPAVV